MTLIPIPEDLLKHPSISAHPKIPALAAAGGVSLDDADSMADVLAFTHEVAAHNVHPDHMRRSDPSPRRSARVLRGELLGHRSPSRSRSRDSRGGSETASAGRYRSRSRPPTTIIEERVGRRGRAGTIGGDEEEEDLKTRIAILEARHENGVRVLLGEKLVPVHKGSTPDLPALESVEVVQQLSEDDLAAWLQHYGYKPGSDKEASANALLACIGVYQ